MKYLFPQLLRRGVMASAILLALEPTHVFSQAAATLDDSVVRRLIQERIETRRNVGLAVGIIDSRGERHVYASGIARAFGSAPVDANTVFEIGSLTKTFTAAILADMVRHGEVSLDDPIERYLPPGVRLNPNGREITLLDLATHSSGLPGMPANFRPANPNDPYADYGTSQLHAFLAGYTPPHPPGEQYVYSNLGVGLLGELLSVHAKTPYETLVARRLLEPLGMTDTRILLLPEMRRRLSTGHNRDVDEVANWNLDALAAAGAFRSTLTDMLKYLAANLDSTNGVLGPVLHDAQLPRRATTIPNTQIGLAWHVLHANGSDIVWHNGETGGYHSFIGFDPLRRVGAVILSNSATSVDDLGFHLVDARIPLNPPPAPPTEIAQDTTIVRQYVATYELAPGAQMNVTRDRSKLYIQLTGQQRFRVFPVSDTTYRLTAVDAQLSFHHDAQGKITEAVLHQGGRDLPARRLP
jgi:D-alanyl-D-alanine-carboxypeptidase/D-alanyl-D-alanine-endopeptidase